MLNRPKPMLLIILDGWGERSDPTDNAIAAANKPTWNKLNQHYPHTTLSGSGPCVGLPEGQMGNSEVGHVNLGLGRVVSQDYTRLNAAIDSGEFFQNPVLNQAIQQAIHTNKTLHLMGLVSPGGVHSHEDHFLAFIQLAAQQGLSKLAVHAFLDGRDTPPKSAQASLAKIDRALAQAGIGQIATICGRYYAMDRDQRWDRVQLAYDMLTQGHAFYTATSAEAALQAAYARDETDEFVKPTIIQRAQPIIDGDIVVFMNFRADRARELSYALTDPEFQGFPRQVKPKLGVFISLTEYDANLAATIAFESQSLRHGMGEILAEQGLRQLRIAETEKYAHVTFFFNGGVETIYPGEDRILVPSPKVATYDLQPEMSAFLLTEKLVAAIDSQQYDLIVCNFANADMVGHTGNFAAAVKAIEVIDQCLAKIYKAIMQVGGEMLITADHGNAEYMFDHTTAQPHTAHTCQPVPLIYVGRSATFTENHGKLADIAPTLLYLMDLPIPVEMTGKNLLALD